METIEDIMRDMTIVAEDCHESYLIDPNTFSSHDTMSDTLISFRDRIAESLKHERAHYESVLKRIKEVDISAANDFDFTDGCGGEDFEDVSMYCYVDDGYCGHNQITDDVRDAVLRGFTAVQETQRMLKGECNGND